MDCSRISHSTFEKYLSPFGRKVWSVLSSLKSDNLFNNASHERQIDRVNRSSAVGRTRHPRINLTYNDTISTIDQLNNQPPFVAHQHNDLIMRSTLDYQNQIPESTDIQDDTTQSYTVITNSPIVPSYMGTIENNKNRIVTKEPQVDWNDFLDKDLLSGFEIEPTKEKPTMRKIIKKDSNRKPKLNSDIESTNKNSYRKLKYTTTVKNWLRDTKREGEDVDNNIENTYLDMDTDVIEGKTKEKKFKHVNISEKNVTDKETKENIYKRADSVRKLKNKLTKKVVQSTLANKNGVMKYSTPKITKNCAVTNIELYEQSDADENNTSFFSLSTGVLQDQISSCVNPQNEEFIDKVIREKERKTRSKFVAPIKSQIPVTDIVYEVIHLTEHVVDTVKGLLEAVESVTMCLVNSDGSCQLSGRLTTDEGVAAGLMVLADHIYYYCKGNDKYIVDFIRFCLKERIIYCYDGKSILIYLMSHLAIDTRASNLNIFDVKVGVSLVESAGAADSCSGLQRVLRPAEAAQGAECALQRCAGAVLQLQQCATSLRDTLLRLQLWSLFRDVEMPLLPIISGMECRGVYVDLNKLKSMENILTCRMREIEQKCHEAAGKTFQINSPVQVRTILYEELKLDTKCNVKIRETICQGAKSTSESMLRGLIPVHPLPKLILEYRHVQKAHATFVSGILSHVRNDIVKPTWTQAAAVTGRVACSNPNLQAIPKTPFNVVLFPDDSTDEQVALNFRSVYVARPGSTLLAADFKHVECRVFAHTAADCGLLGALSSPDLFKVLAAKWLQKDEESVSQEERERTKRIVYASLYGAGARKLMEILGVTYEHALAVLAGFHRTFPTLKSFGRNVVSQCEQRQGRLRTASGRCRVFSNIGSSDHSAKCQAERQAINFMVQGLAADICKIAMVMSDSRLRRHLVRCELLLQIHDELVWEVITEDVQSAAGVIQSTMEHCGRQFGVEIPLPVSLRRGGSWGGHGAPHS